MNRNVLVFTLVMVAGVGFGCGKSQTYESRDGTVKVRQQGDAGAIEVTTADGKATLAAGDAGVAIPETFPKDVPVLDGAVPQMSMTQGKSQVLQFRVPGSVGEVMKQYEVKLKAEGWEIATSMNMGDSSMVHAKKGKRECAATVLKDDNGTMVSLSVTEE
jgi:hypothetical protein